MSCGYCHDRGHNKTTCPKMKKDYDESLVTEKDERTYWQHRIIPVYEHIQEKKARRVERAKHRSCTYCSHSGHNRRTCPTKATMFDLHRRAARIAQNMYVDRVLESGLFKGTLFERERITTDGYHKDAPLGKQLFFLKRIPAPLPLIVKILREDSDWYTLPVFGQESQMDDFYNSDRYKEICDESYSSRCRFVNIRLIGLKSANQDNINYYDKETTLSESSNEKLFCNEIHSMQGLSPSQIREELLRQHGHLAIYKGYKAPMKLTVHIRSSNPLSKPLKELRTNETDFYTSKESYSEENLKLLTQYVDALSFEYEFKHF